MYKLASTTWDKEEIQIANELISSNNLTMGENVKDFEKKFATYIGTKYAVMFNSGSSANLAIFTALKYVKNSQIQEGDNIIVKSANVFKRLMVINIRIVI